MRNTNQQKKNHSQHLALLFLFAQPMLNAPLVVLFAIFFYFCCFFMFIKKQKEKQNRKKKKRKNMKAHEWLASSGYYFYTIIFLSDAIVPAKSAFFISFISFLLSCSFVQPDLSSECWIPLHCNLFKCTRTAIQRQIDGMVQEKLSGHVARQT